VSAALRGAVRPTVAAMGVCLGSLAACGDPTAPRLIVEGRLPGPAGAVSVSFADDAARGEWWPCDGRLTASRCDEGRFPVQVFLTPPTIVDVAGTGGATCVQDDEADGAWEAVERAFFNRRAMAIGTTAAAEIGVFVHVGVDANGNGRIDPGDPDETRAIARLDSGTVLVTFANGFTDPVGLEIRGSVAGAEVRVDYVGAMANPQTVPEPPGPDACTD
jgi:hypothetical protein